MERPREREKGFQADFWQSTGGHAGLISQPGDHDLSENQESNA